MSNHHLNFDGAKLERLRLAKFLAVHEVVAAIHAQGMVSCSSTTYRNWEEGKSQPNYEYAGALAAALGVDRDYFEQEKTE